MRIVGLVPARGGSKGIPYKNITPCAGKPLIAHTLEEVKKSAKLCRTFVSTDDEKIASVCREYGGEVPFLRPVDVSGDHVPMIEVVRHFCHWLQSESIDYDAIMLLQPTSPLRKACHIDEAISIFEKERPASLVSVVTVPHNFNPESLMTIQSGKLCEKRSDGIYLRQQKVKYYARNGPAVLIMSQTSIDSGQCYARPCIPYVMDFFDSVDVDDYPSLRTAELFMHFGKSKLDSQDLCNKRE